MALTTSDSFATNQMAYLLPPTNEVWGKVIFLHLSVILFTGGGTWAGTPWTGTPPWAGTPPGRYTPWAGTPPGQVHPPGRYTPWAGTPPSRYTLPWAGTPPPAMHAGIRSTSGRYTSYWNAFLFKNKSYLPIQCGVNSSVQTASEKCNHSWLA